MKKIWEFFENLNECVYVSDMDTYEVVYMNKKARETYGIASLEDISGRKCYELLHGNRKTCAICNNSKLVEGNFEEWRYYNPILDKYLVLKDTMIYDEGRRCRIEIAMDVSAQEKKDNMLLGYQNLEARVNEGLRIALQAPTPDKSIDIILEYLGEALNGERTYIFEKNESGGDDNTYEWVANGVSPEKDNLQNLPQEICANWYQNFSEDKNIIIKDLEDIKESDPLQYENLKRQDIHSLVVVPLYDERKIIGFYGVDNPPVKFLEYAQNMLQIMGHFIISSLKRRDLVNQLQKMSFCDQLTQMGNRYAMNEYIAAMRGDESIGVVYCDITGLKRVNDTEGHKAGDRLIIRACESMKRVFGDYGVFRIGGDELLALCANIEEKSLKNRVETLKKDMEENSVVMAVGSIWQKDGMIDIDWLLSESERLMYEDKDAYYETMVLDRRKL